jgi:hypothetical protein
MFTDVEQKNKDTLGMNTVHHACVKVIIIIIIITSETTTRL